MLLKIKFENLIICVLKYGVDLLRFWNRDRGTSTRCRGRLRNRQRPGESPVCRSIPPSLARLRPSPCRPPRQPSLLPPGCEVRVWAETNISTSVYGAADSNSAYLDVSILAAINFSPHILGLHISSFRWTSLNHHIITCQQDTFQWTSQT